ncbi:Helix-turn-helix domain [uncultured Clostridium sp.]|nr:Helix-turn-helix domain [uncultured Clostridium sp.]
MYKNKIDNMNNLSGIAIRNLRIEKGWSQRELADALQLLGLDLDKNAIQRIETRKRFVTDIELTYFSKIFEVDYSVLLDSQAE